MPRYISSVQGQMTNEEGGDIDILVIGEKELTGQEKRNIKLLFCAMSRS